MTVPQNEGLQKAALNLPSTKKSYATGECNNLRKYNIILIDIYLYNKQIPYHHPLCHFKKICA